MRVVENSQRLSDIKRIKKGVIEIFLLFPKHFNPSIFLFGLRINFLDY
jgi:hypothetical protein